MIQSGLVVAIKEDLAVVRFERSEACSNCRACQMGRTDMHDVSIPNLCGAQVGDMVQVELHADKLVKASAIVYIFPLAAFVLGLLIAPRILTALAISMDSELFSCSVALLLMGAAFAAVRLTEKKRRAKGEFSPKMIEIMKVERQE